MTATDELRRMLDERGVEWMDDSYGQLWCTVWHGSDGKQWRMNENMSGMLTELRAWRPTPAQAIEATLGRGTCKPVDGYDDDGEEIGTVCSECGSPWPIYYVVRYCPVCGCKVVDDASVD